MNRESISNKWLRRSGTVLTAAGLLAYAAGATGSGASNNQPLQVVSAPRVVIHKSARQLYLFDGARLVRRYPVDLGTEPIGTKRIGADQKTPEGSFRVATRNADSPYHRFLGLDYPDEPAIVAGLTDGLISIGEATMLREARDADRCPNWATSLGGGVGIHGHRKGYDWTGGCIALADEHIEELFRVLRIGDPVEIVP